MTSLFRRSIQLFSVLLLIGSLTGCSEDSGVEPKLPILSGPGVVNFGSVPTGSCKDTTIRYDNTTGKTITLTSATFAGAGFEWTGADLPIAVVAGGSVDLKVRYCPTSEDSASAELLFKGTGGEDVKIKLLGLGAKPETTGPTVGSTYTYNVFETDASGAAVAGTEQIEVDEIVDAGITYEGKSNVFVVMEGSIPSYYAIESNGDISAYISPAQGGPFGALVGGWKTMPYGSKKTNVTLMTQDTTINDPQFPVPITAKIKQTASYAGESTLVLNGVSYVVENVTLTTSVDLVAVIVPVGNITNTVQAGFIRAIGYQANFDSQLESTVQGFEGGGSRKKLKSFVKK
jgi:hypothetical protein